MHIVTAVLKHLPERKKKGKKPWCLVSKSTGRPLQCWDEKPSKKEVGKAERRIQYFKHKKGSIEKVAVEVSHEVSPETLRNLDEILNSLCSPTLCLEPETLRELEKIAANLKNMKVEAGADRAQLVYAKSILNDAIHGLREAAMDLPREFSVEVSGLREVIADLKKLLSEITVTVRHEFHIPRVTRDNIIVLIAATLAAAVSYKILTAAIRGISRISRDFYKKLLSLYKSGPKDRKKIQKELVKELKKMGNRELKELHKQVRKVRRSQKLQRKLK